MNRALGHPRSATVRAATAIDQTDGARDDQSPRTSDRRLPSVDRSRPAANPAEPAGEGDRLIGGARAEYKTLGGLRNPTPDALSKAIANRAMNARSQAAHVVIDTRGQPCMTLEIADRGLRRAFGADNAVASVSGEPPRIASIRVIIRRAAGNDADRITGATAHGGGHLRADYAAAWAGYIAALLDWGQLTPDDHGQLLSRLPPSAAAAVLPIFLGPDAPTVAKVTKQTTTTRAAG